MYRNASRDAMQAAAPRLCRTRHDEEALKEWLGAHPLDDPALTGGYGRDAERTRVRALNRRASRRLAFVCGREDRARTKSTAQLEYEAAEAVRDALDLDAEPAAVAALEAARAALEAAHLAAASLAVADPRDMLLPPEPGEAAARVRELAAAVRQLEAAALATCDPRALAEVAATAHRLAERHAEVATRRRARLQAAEPEPFAATERPPILVDDTGPPGLDTNPATLTRRASLAVRPTAERLTRTLALAPGAPSRAVCV